MKTMIAIFAFVAFSAVAYLRRKEQRGTYRKVAEELGLDVDGHAFRGTLAGYHIETRQVRRRQSRYSKVGAKVLEAELRTTPVDLVLDRESITSTVARKAGIRDVEVHDKQFDDVFRIACQDEGETRAWLGDDARRAALLELNGLVDALEISDRTLHVEIPTDPVEEADVRHLLEWFVAIARRLDEPSPASSLPPLEVTLRARRSKWGPLIAIAVVVLPMVLFASWFIYFFWSLGAFEKREPRENIGVWSSGHGMSVPKKEEFIRCVETTPKAPDVDFAECEQLALEVNIAFKDVREAYVTMRTIQARRAARVELDRSEVEETLQTLVRETEGSIAHDKLVREDVVPQYWTHGLHDRYLELVVAERDQQRDPFPGDLSLSILQTGDASGHAYRAPGPKYLAAMRCLHSDTPPRSHMNSAREMHSACGGGIRTKWRHSGRTRTLVVPKDEVLAALEDDPKRVSGILAQASPGTLDPEVELAWLVVAQSDIAPDLHRASADPAELAPKLAPLACTTPWLPHDAFGEPAMLIAAAERAGPLADRLRLYAARQWVLRGQQDKASEVLGAITSDGIEAICAAQLESAMGAPAEALKRLEAVTDPHDGLLYLARAQAHTLAGEWQHAYDAGHDALVKVPRVQRDHAALVVIAAAAKLQREDGLDEVLGPVPDAFDLRDDSVEVTRWLGYASQDDANDGSDRWIAPDSLPLTIGSEPLQFIAAQELAAGKDVELWLDILMPVEFEAVGVALGRRIAAEIRGDHDAAATWGQLERKHLEPITNPAKARVYRIARRYEGL